MEEWSQLCYAESVYDASCHSEEAIVSPMRIFEPEDLVKSKRQLVEDFMERARDNNVWAPVAPNFARHEDIFWSNGDRVNMMRTFLRFGAPIDITDTDFSTKTDRLEEQKAFVRNF